MCSSTFPLHTTSLSPYSSIMLDTYMLACATLPLSMATITPSTNLVSQGCLEQC